MYNFKDVDISSYRFYIRKTLHNKKKFNGPNLETFSFLFQKSVKIAHFFSHSLYHLEGLPCNQNIDKQNERLESLANKIKNIRNIEDNELKNLKFELYTIKQRNRDKKESCASDSAEKDGSVDEDDIICVGDGDEQEEVPQWKIDAQVNKIKRNQAVIPPPLEVKPVIPPHVHLATPRFSIDSNSDGEDKMPGITLMLPGSKPSPSQDITLTIPEKNNHNSRKESFDVSEVKPASLSNPPISLAIPMPESKKEVVSLSVPKPTSLSIPIPTNTLSVAAPQKPAVVPGRKKSVCEGANLLLIPGQLKPDPPKPTLTTLAIPLAATSSPPQLLTIPTQKPPPQPQPTTAQPTTTLALPTPSQPQQPQPKSQPPQQPPQPPQPQQTQQSQPTAAPTASTLSPSKKPPPNPFGQGINQLFVPQMGANTQVSQRSINTSMLAASISEPVVKDFMKKQTAIMEVDRYLKEIEKSGGINNIIAIKEEQGRKNPPPNRQCTDSPRKKIGEAMGSKFTFETDSRKKGGLHIRMSHTKSEPSTIYPEIHSQCIKIKIKKSLIFFYDLMERALSELMNTHSLAEIEAIRIVKKLADMKYCLKENKLYRWYLVELLQKEIILRKEIFGKLEAIQNKFKITKVETFGIKQKHKDFKITKTPTATYEDAGLNPLAHREFCRLLSSVSSQNVNLRETMTQVADLIKEYLEVKESLYGVKIGDEKTVLEYFVKAAFKDGTFELPVEKSFESRIEEKSLESSIKDSSSEGSIGQDSNGPVDVVVKRQQRKQYSEQLSVSDVSTSRSFQSNFKDEDFKYKEFLKKYKTVKVLSQTNSSKVTLVECRSSKCQYALRISKQAPLDYQRNLQRAIHVDGPNENINDFVVRAISEVKFKDKVCTLMEYMENGSLKQFLKQNRNSIGGIEIMKILANLVLCIETLHAIKYVNYKINPENILVNSMGHVKLNFLGRPLLRIADTVNVDVRSMSDFKNSGPLNFSSMIVPPSPILAPAGRGSKKATDVNIHFDQSPTVKKPKLQLMGTEMDLSVDLFVDPSISIGDLSPSSGGKKEELCDFWSFGVVCAYCMLSLTDQEHLLEEGATIGDAKEYMRDTIIPLIEDEEAEEMIEHCLFARDGNIDYLKQMRYFEGKVLV